MTAGGPGSGAEEQRERRARGAGQRFGGRRAAAVWDVVVVGAGPAGASAAHAAAVAGRRVLLLEKAELPRYKTCGGGIIGPSRDACRPASNCRCGTGCTRSPSASTAGSTRTRRSRQMLFGLINRPEFDEGLVEAAQKAGAEVRTGVTVSRVEQHGPAVPDRRTVACRGGSGRWRRCLARAVVGADGSASRIGAHVGVKLDQVDLGLEAEIPVPATVAEDWAGGCSSTGARCPAVTAGSSPRATRSRSA